MEQTKPQTLLSFIRSFSPHIVECQDHFSCHLQFFFVDIITRYS